MIKQGDIVKVKYNDKRVLNPDMMKWIEEHLDVKFYVERVCETSAKLKRVEFWITFDLLEKI